MMKNSAATCRHIQFHLSDETKRSVRAARGLPPSSLGLMSVAREKPSQTEGLRTRLQDPLVLNFFSSDVTSND